MDFSVINEAPSGSLTNSRMINIILAENGSLSEYPSIKFVSPIGLKRASFLLDFVEKEFGINKGNQLILRSEDGKQLDANMNLEEFFKKDTTVYLYVIKGQAQENTQDDFEVIGGMSLEKRWSESIMQFIPTFYENYLGSNVKDILESNIVGYYNELMAYFSDIKSELNVIKDGSIKLKRQKTAEEVAKKNLSNYYGEKKKKFDETISEREAKIDLIQQYIDNFDASLNKLTKIEIDPQLGEEDKKHLSDYFDTEKLRTYRTNYEKNQIKIKQKAQEIKDEIVQYDSQLQNIEGAVKDNSVEIQNLLRDQENLYVDIQDTNIQGFKNLIEEKKGNPTQKDLSDFVKKEYEIALPKLKEISQELTFIKDKLEDQLKENSTKLKELISDVLNLRVIIKGKIYNKLKVFCSLVDKHAEQIFNLEIIEKFPLVYEKSLIEIKRRIIFKKDYLTILNILERFGDSENRCRQEFLEIYQQYLPKSFCPFLSKTFPQLNFDNIRRMIDQDVGADFSDLAVNSNRGGSAEGDMIKLLHNLNNNLENKDNKNKELENLLEDLRDENENLKEQMKQRVFSVNNLRRLLEVSGFQDKIDDFLGAYKQKVSDKIDLVEKRFSTLQSEKIDSVNKILVDYQEKLKINNTEALEKIAELENQLKEKDAKIQSLSEAINDKENKSKRIDEEKLEKQNLLDASMNENKLLADKQKALEDEHTALINQREDLKDKVVRLEEEIKSLMEVVNEYSKKENEDKSKVEEKLSKKEIALKDVEEKLSAMTKEKEGFSSQIQQLKNVIRELENSLKESREKLGDLEKEKAEKDKKLATLNVSIKQSQTKVEELQNEVKELEKKCTVAQDAVNTKTKALTEAEKKFEESNKEVKYLKLVLNDQTNKINASNQKDEEIKKLKETLTVKEGLVKDNNKLIEEQQCEIEELRKTISQRENVNQDLSYINNVIGELGEKILCVYAYLQGRDDPKLNQETDISGILDEVLTLMKTSMVKIDEFRVEDRVLAVKINDGEGVYLVVKNEQPGIRIPYIYKSQQELGDIIVGEINRFEDYENNALLNKKLGSESIIPIDLINIHSVSTVPIHKFK